MYCFFPRKFSSSHYLFIVLFDTDMFIYRQEYRGPRSPSEQKHARAVAAVIEKRNRTVEIIHEMNAEARAYKIANKARVEKVCSI
jgi:hypothetical protein